MTPIPSSPIAQKPAKIGSKRMSRQKALADFMDAAAAWLTAADSCDDGAEDRHDTAYCNMHSAASIYFYRYGCLREEARAARIEFEKKIGGGV